MFKDLRYFNNAHLKDVPSEIQKEIILLTSNKPFAL